MPREPDIVSDFCERILTLDPNVSIRTIDVLRYQLRTEYGGKRVYIAQSPPGDPRRRARGRSPG